MTPLHLEVLILREIEIRSLIGRHIHSIPKSDQFVEKASINSVPGSKYNEANLFNFLLLASANRSNSKWKMDWMLLKLFSSMDQLSEFFIFEPASAIAILGSSRLRWIGIIVKSISFSKDKIVKITSWMCGLLDPFETKETTFSLSVIQNNFFFLTSRVVFQV